MTAAETCPSSATRIALVMPAHKLGADFEASVRSVEQLDPPPEEFVIVVDGNPEMARQLAPFHDVIEIGSSGPAAARNAGVAGTSSAIVLFVDSDVIVPANLITLVRRAFAMNGAQRVDAIVGSYDASPASPTVVSQFRNLLHHWTHQQAGGAGHTFWGACGAVYRTAFDAVGGFDERYDDATIEDIELGERLTAAGFHIEMVPWVQVTHLKQWTLTGMVHTDVAKRGIPWSRLILSNRSMANDLNTTWAARINVAMAALFAGALVGAVGVPSSRLKLRLVAIAAALGATLSWRDRRFLRFLRRGRSTVFAIQSLPLLWIHHLCSAAAFAWAVATWPITRNRVRSPRT